MRRYRDAATYVCDVVEDLIVDGQLNFIQSTFANGLVGHVHGIEIKKIRMSDSLIQLYGLEQEEQYASCYVVDVFLAFHLVKLSENRPEFFDLCCEICSHNLLMGVFLPVPLQHFASRFLEGSMSRPTPRHRPRTPNWFEQNFLWSLTKELNEDFGLDITRNDATPGKISACDAVAEGLTVCGRKTSYTDIKNLMVHPDHAQARAEFETTFKIASKRPLSDLDAEPDSLSSLDEIKRMFSDVLDIQRTFPANKK